MNYLFSILDALFISMPVIREILSHVDSVIKEQKGLKFSVDIFQAENTFVACIPVPKQICRLGYIK
jgi:hypothetical protein